MRRADDQPAADAGTRTTGRRQPQVIGMATPSLWTSLTDRRISSWAPTSRSASSHSGAVTGVACAANRRVFRMPASDHAANARAPAPQIARSRRFHVAGGDAVLPPAPAASAEPEPPPAPTATGSGGRTRAPAAAAPTSGVTGWAPARVHGSGTDTPGRMPPASGMTSTPAIARAQTRCRSAAERLRGSAVIAAAMPSNAVARTAASASADIQNALIV